MRTRVLALTMGLVFLASALGRAGVFEFHHPPDAAPPAPADWWVTPFPYQRNVVIGFSTDPHTWPIDPDPAPVPPGAAKDLVPGVNYQVNGTHDPQLHDSDWFYWEGTSDPEWIDVDPDSGRQGLFGITGGLDQSVALVWKLDNLPYATHVKHVWVEMEYFVGGSGGWSAALLSDPPSPIQIVTGQIEELDVDPATGDGWYRLYGGFEIEQNPLYEFLALELTTDPLEGGALVIDYIHVATECVGTAIPEPGPAVLIALSLLGLVRRGVRRP